MSPCLSHFCHSNLQNCHKEHAICICIEDLLTKMTMFHYHLRSPQSVVSTVFRSPLRRAEPAATDQPRLAIAVTKLTVTHFHEPQWQPHTGLSEKNKKQHIFRRQEFEAIWHRIQRQQRILPIHRRCGWFWPWGRNHLTKVSMTCRFFSQSRKSSWASAFGLGMGVIVKNI